MYRQLVEPLSQLSLKSKESLEGNIVGGCSGIIPVQDLGQDTRDTE